MSVLHRPARPRFKLSLLEIMIIAGGFLAAAAAGIASSGFLPL